MVYGCTFLLELSHMDFGFTFFARAVPYGLWVHILLELSHMVYP